MATQTFTGTTTKWTLTAAELRAAIAAAFPAIALPDMGEGEGDDLYISQGGGVIGLMDHHADIELTTYDAEPSA